MEIRLMPECLFHGQRKILAVAFLFSALKNAAAPQEFLLRNQQLTNFLAKSLECNRLFW